MKYLSITFHDFTVKYKIGLGVCPINIPWVFPTRVDSTMYPKTLSFSHTNRKQVNLSEFWLSENICVCFHLIYKRNKCLLPVKSIFFVAHCRNPDNVPCFETIFARSLASVPRLCLRPALTSECSTRLWNGMLESGCHIDLAPPVWTV